MSSRHQRRADTAAFRRASGDLLVDLFEAGTSLHGRPHAGLKQRTLGYWDKGSYSPTSQCFVCGWYFRSHVRLAGAFLRAVRASDPCPTVSPRHAPRLGEHLHPRNMHECPRSPRARKCQRGARWVQLPAKPLIDSDGNVQRTGDGRFQYALIFNFDDRAVREAFSRAVIDALIRFEPDAFSETVA